jgi:hypothetical protein
MATIRKHLISDFAYMLQYPCLISVHTNKLTPESTKHTNNFTSYYICNTDNLSSNYTSRTQSWSTKTVSGPRQSIKAYKIKIKTIMAYTRFQYMAKIRKHLISDFAYMLQNSSLISVYTNKLTPESTKHTPNFKSIYICNTHNLSTDYTTRTQIWSTKTVSGPRQSL